MVPVGQSGIRDEMEEPDTPTRARMGVDPRCRDARVSSLGTTCVVRHYYDEINQHAIMGVRVD
jgi:hypothetical protein